MGNTMLFKIQMGVCFVKLLYILIFSSYIHIKYYNLFHIQFDAIKRSGVDPKYFFEKSSKKVLRLYGTPGDINMDKSKL